jgi:hypothetical protein
MMPSQNPIGNIAVSVADMLPLLLDAIRHDRAWLEDFADEVVHVPQDLYEVLVAYRCMMEQEAA